MIILYRLVGELAQQLRLNKLLAEDPSSVLSTHVGQLTKPAPGNLVPSSGHH